MSENGFQFNKINEYILKNIHALSLLSAYIEEFSEKGTQESLDNLTFLLQQIDDQTIVTKNYVLNLIKQVAGIENGEVNVIKSDNGFEF